MFEPFYESYGPDAILAGASLRYVTLRPPDWAFDPDELRGRVRAAHPRDRDRLAAQPDREGVHARGARDDRRAVHRARRDRDHRRDLRAHHLRRRASTCPIATLPGMRERTVTISALSKTYARDRLARRLGDRGARADGGDPRDARLPDGGGGDAAAARGGRRRSGFRRATTSGCAPSTPSGASVMMRVLAEAGFAAEPPQGAYYVMADVSSLGFDDDVAAARHLVEEVGVAAVPGSSFFSRAGARRAPAAVRVPEAARDAGGGRRAAAGCKRQPRANAIRGHVRRDDR